MLELKLGLIHGLVGVGRISVLTLAGAADCEPCGCGTRLAKPLHMWRGGGNCSGRITEPCLKIPWLKHLFNLLESHPNNVCMKNDSLFRLRHLV